MLSLHVIKTSNVYYNTVTKKRLPIDSSIELLQKYYFLRGQEREGIESAILNKPTYKLMGLSIAPTFECNLRCTHCMVKHLLTENEESKLDIAGLKTFISRCKDRYELEHLIVMFYGGESLLALQDSIDVIDELKTIVETRFSLFTNLSMELTEQHISFLSGATTIGVSIDGLEEQHNQQRLWLDENNDDNAFQIVTQNLKKLVLAGLKDKIAIQACLRDEFSTPEIHQEFYKLGLRYGIKPEKVTIGVIGPSKTDPEPSDRYMQGLQSATFVSTSCCKYRHHNLSVDNTGSIYSDYYSYTKLGSIYDDPSVIEERQEKLIRETAPALNDIKCQTCPVLGYCWGGCSVIENTGNKLSKYCDKRRKETYEKMKEYAKSDVLIRRERSHEPDIH